MAQSEMARLGQKLFGPPNYGTWDYTTGLYCEALIRLSETTRDPAFEKNAEATIGSFIGPDGQIATYETKHRPRPLAPSETPTPTPPPTDADILKQKVKVPYSLDEVESGVATLHLYEITHDERYHKAADILRHQLSVHPRIPEGGFWHKAIYPNQMWLDGLYMGEPFYAAYATHFNEPQDFDDISRQFTLIAAHTYDPASGLLYHGWDESKKEKWANPQTGASPSFWGRAIGWYAMALVDVIPLMPANHPARPVLLDLLGKVAAGIVKWQDPATGVWWQVTDQGARPHNYLEASSSSMFDYTLAKAVNLGYLPRSYLPAIHAGYQGIVHQFITASPDGASISLNHICKVAGLDNHRLGTFDYYTQKEPIVSNDLKGVGPFINAGIECQKLFPNETFAP